MVDSLAPWQVPPPQRPPAPQAVQSGAVAVTQLPAAQLPTVHSAPVSQVVPSAMGAATQLPAWQLSAVQSEASVSQVVPSEAGAQTTQSVPLKMASPQVPVLQESVVSAEMVRSSSQTVSVPPVELLSLV